MADPKQDLHTHIGPHYTSYVARTSLWHMLVFMCNHNQWQIVLQGELPALIWGLGWVICNWVHQTLTSTSNNH